MEMDLQAAKNILDESGMQSIPIVKIDNIYIGGYDQLEAYINGVEQRAM
jgi:glutaredoxin